MESGIYTIRIQYCDFFFQQISMEPYSSSPDHYSCLKLKQYFIWFWDYTCFILNPRNKSPKQSNTTCVCSHLYCCTPSVTFWNRYFSWYFRNTVCCPPCMSTFWDAHNLDIKRIFLLSTDTFASLLLFWSLYSEWREWQWQADLCLMQKTIPYY